GVHLYTNYTGGSSFNQPQNTSQLYRYLSAHINPSLGDGLCNYNVLTDHICFVKNDGHNDSKDMLSTGPASLAPGASVSLVTAYVFASAVAIPTCAQPGCPSVLPGDPRHLSDAAYLTSTGANRVDSIAGFTGFVDDNADGKVQGSEFRAVRGSLIQKAQLAQAIFDRGFLLPSAPEAPDFFLVPGDDQVSILWRPSATETSGDPFFSIASDPASPAYDPNYRESDVEGYRIYRGRVGDPAKLTLLAQFDRSDTRMRDYLGVIRPGGNCAPELGRRTTADGCPVDFSAPAPGSPYTTFVEYDISSHFIQVRLGDRFLALDSTPYITAADTAVTGAGSGYPEIWDNGVPFIYVDRTVKNDLRYFYTVTAFDVNSIQSGPSSLESARVVKGAIPQAPGSNYDNSASLAIGVFGRGVNMTETIPTSPRIDDTTGVFSGPARPATGASIGAATEIIPQLLSQSGESSLILDSMSPGSAYDLVPNTYWYSIVTPAGKVPATVSVVQDQFNGSVDRTGQIDGPPVDPSQVARYGGSGSYDQAFQYSLNFAGNYYTASYGRGCINGAPGFGFSRCAYNGARWFEGAAETFPHPNRGNNPTNPSPGLIVDRTNAGSLAGSNVLNVYEARSYQTRPNTYRHVEGVLGGVATAADYRLFWGAGGTVDSVVDITHNVLVPFKNDMTRGYTWGFLTQAATASFGSGDNRTGVLSVTDLGCVKPLHTVAWTSANGHLNCQAGTTFNFVNTVSFGPLAFGNSTAADGTVTPTTNLGFGIYLAGHFFLMEMNSPAPSAPPAGTIWTLRTYVGAISGGGGSVGTAGNLGSYTYFAWPSPFTAVGASLTARYTVTNAIRQATKGDLAAVHTVPDPFYLANGYETGNTTRVIKFVDLPTQAIIRIYTLSGILVRVIEHNSALNGGSEDWDIRHSDGRLAASGVYFYHIEAPSGARRVGRMTLVTSGR
ncbi:MAG TPA: hypothetical protein VG940_07125, partial [Gemmatimonadales bacterium]|nr:hypothetical protein [Gemmatimonadales bacterium]